LPLRFYFMSALGDVLDHDERLVLDLFLDEFKPETPLARFMLGALVSRIFLEPGECRSRPKFGYYAGITRERVRQIEERVLRKLRNWKSLDAYRNGSVA
jgi:hypothetical protein